jgi:hypothetical protein
MVFTQLIAPQLLVANMDDLVRVRSHLPGQISGSFHSTTMFPSRQHRSPLAGASRQSRVRQSRARQSQGRLTRVQTPVGKLHIQLPVRRAQKKSGSNRPDGASGSDSDTGAAAVAIGSQSKTQALLQTGVRRFSLTPRASMDMIPFAVSVDAEADATPSSVKEYNAETVSC